MLRTQHLAVGYPRKTLLKDVQLTAGKSECIALLGLNGSGKSTLLRTLAGFLAPQSGEVFWQEASLHSISAAERAKLMAVVTTERFKTGNMTVFEVVSMGRYPHTGLLGNLNDADLLSVQSAIGECALNGLEDAFYAELSDGQKQRVLIARALAQETPAILLDEPTSFLDIKGKAEVFGLMGQLQNRLVIFSTHEIDKAVEVATRLWVIDVSGDIHDLPSKGVDTRGDIYHLLGFE